MRAELDNKEFDEAIFEAAKRKLGLGEGQFVYEVSLEVEVIAGQVKRVAAFCEIDPLAHSPAMPA